MQIKTFRRKSINLQKKIRSFLIKKGKKNKITKVLNFSFFKLCKLSGKPLGYMLSKFFSSLNIFVETKTIKVRRRRYVVPFPLTLRRRVYLISKWLVLILRKNRNRIPFCKKLMSEIFFVLQNKKSEILKLKNTNNSRALSNRSNLHYRW